MDASHRARRTRVRILAWSVGALAALGAGCGNAPPQDAEPSTLTLLYPGDEGVLGPAWEMPAKFLVFLPLVSEDAEGEVEGRLARAWTYSADGRTWTFHLRPDVKWHDGVPVTAHDVAFTLELLERAGWAVPGERRAEVVDDTTVVVRYREPPGRRALDSWTTPYPRHLLDTLDAAAFTDWDFWTRPVGNGPFRYVRHMPKTMVELEANPDYYAGRPRIDRIVLKLAGTGEGASAVTELLGGNVDVAWASGIDLIKLGRDPRFVAYHVIENAQELIWNQRTYPPFRDARVRRALTLAIDRAGLIGALNLPAGTPVVDGIHSRGQLARGELAPPLPHDRAAAERLLAEAGWRDVDGDGVRERAGEPLRFTLLATPRHADAAVYVQAQLRRVGVQVDVQAFSVGGGRHPWRTGEFQAGLIQPVFGANRFGAPQFFGDSSIIGYTDPQFAALRERGERAVDPAEVDSILRQMNARLREDVPMTFLYPWVHTIVAGRWVRGLEAPHRIDPLTAADALWLEEERR